MDPHVRPVRAGLASDRECTHRIYALSWRDDTSRPISSADPERTVRGHLPRMDGVQRVFRGGFQRVGISKRAETRAKHAFWPLCPAISATANGVTPALRSSPLDRPPIARQRGCSRSGPPVSRCHDAPPTGANTARGDGTRSGRAARRDPHTPDSIAEYRETSSGPGAVHPLRPGS
jgi:hypothetical protein